MICGVAAKSEKVHAYSLHWRSLHSGRCYLKLSTLVYI